MTRAEICPKCNGTKFSMVFAGGIEYSWIGRVCSNEKCDYQEKDEFLSGLEDRAAKDLGLR